MPKELQITEEIYESWQQEIHTVAIPDNVCSVVTTIRKRLREEASKDGNKNMDFYVSDRRWKKCFYIMQTAAFLNGRHDIDLTDIPILFHCLWNTAEVIPSIIDIVASSLTGEINKKMDKIQKEIDQAIKKKSQPVKKRITFYFSLLFYDYTQKCPFRFVGYELLFVTRFLSSEQRAWSGAKALG